MATKKDFQIAAALINKLYTEEHIVYVNQYGIDVADQICGGPVGRWSKSAIVVENQFASYFHQTSKAFDESRFREACRTAYFFHQIKS